MSQSHARRTSRPRTPGPGARAPVQARRVVASGRPHRSARDPGPAGHHPPARPRPHPLRPHGRVTVRLLPGGGRGDGRRPGPRGPLAPRRPALRGRPPGQLRRVRLPGAGHDLRRQRLRRDAARAVRVGPQAPGRQHRGGRPRAAASTTPCVASWWASRPAATARPSASSARCATSSSGTSGSTPPTLVARWGRPRPAQGDRALPAAGAKARSKDHLKAVAKLTERGRRPAAVPGRPAAADAGRGRCSTPAHEAEMVGQPAATPSTEYRGHPVRRPPAPAGRVRVRRPGPQGGGRRVASAPAAGWRCSWAATRATRWSCRSRRPSTRWPSRSSGPASTPTGAAGGRGPAPGAERQRHLPRVGHGHRRRRHRPRLLLPPAVGLEAVGRHRHHGAGRVRGLRPDVRMGPGPRPRPLGRCHRHRLLPRGRRPGSTRPCAASPPPTPTRTRRTTTPSSPAIATDRVHAITDV